MDGRQLWNMGLFDQETLTNNKTEWVILRVPGGWIMREAHAPNAAYAFVPLDNEFSKDTPR